MEKKGGTTPPSTEFLGLNLLAAFEDFHSSPPVFSVHEPRQKDGQSPESQPAVNAQNLEQFSGAVLELLPGWCPG